MEAFRDLKLYSCTLIILLTGVPSGAIGTFGTIVINGFGFSHFDSLALTCPIGAITALAILITGYITRKLSNVRYFAIMICALISVAGTLICWLGPRSDRGLLFAGIFLMAVQVAAGGLAVSLAASNVAGHTSKYFKRLHTFEIMLTRSRESYNQCYHLYWVLRWECDRSRDFGASPGPEYHSGFVGSCICLCCVVVIAAITYFLLRRENAKRDRTTGGPLGLHNIDEDLSDMQNQDFRYVL